MEIAVRPATEQDGDRLADLASAAIEEQAGSRGGGIWSRREARFEPPEPSTRFVGTIDDAVVGYVAVGVEDLGGGDRLGIVTAIYVEPGAREVAVGEALLDATLAWCREQGCVGVDAHALPGNRGTKNFFESFGLTARLIVVHREL